MTPTVRQNDWRLAHGVLFVVLMAGAMLIPPLRGWPWLWVVPFCAYFLLVGCVPSLRRSFGWLRVGKFSTAAIAATIVIMALTVSVLILFNAIARPDVRGYRAVLPLDALGGFVMAGVVFTVVNATLEEFVFRGVLFDALQSQWGAGGTLVGTALLFGLGHLRGYPPGYPGTCLAAGFGFLMGVLRLWTGGLVLPIVAHMAADATIYAMIAGSEVT